VSADTGSRASARSHTEQRGEPQAVVGGRTFRIADDLLALVPDALLRVSGVGWFPGEWLRGRCDVSGAGAGPSVRVGGRVAGSPPIGPVPCGGEVDGDFPWARLSRAVCCRWLCGSVRWPGG